MAKYKGKSLSPSTLLLLIFVASCVFQQICSAQSRQRCGPSSCGKIQNISYPFRLQDDPVGCGDPRYELACENNVTVLHLFNGKFHVQQIDYSGYIIRVTDAGIQVANCISFPEFFLSSSNFSAEVQHRGLDQITNLMSPMKIVFLNCGNPVSDPSYVDMDSVRPRCVGHSRGTGHVYALVGSHTVEDIRDGCFLQSATFAPFGLQTNEYNLTLTPQIGGYNNVSEADIHALLVYGFELYWLNAICDQQCGKGTQCEVVDYTTGQVQCFRPSCHYAYQTSYHCGILSQGFGYTLAYVRGILNGMYSIITLRQLPSDLSPIGTPGLPFERFFTEGLLIGRYGVPSLVAARFLFGVALLVMLFICKWRRRHLSVYENIERFLHDNSIYPIRYSYKEIKKMTQGFKVKLGEGGFGSVYRGNLRSGPFVAIKVLGKSKAKIGKGGEPKTNSGQDFISEVATIGRIHHMNVVRLIGYCVEGSKRALVYEFMSNGSLDKYISSKEGSVLLSHEKIFEICLGVARGISYLHQGCDMQILHFDIKPHNILIDENFIPKVSDFGLAKLYPMDNSIVTATGARGRGTLGYMAPELYFNNIGGVSYKADVYSFGKLLMEMVTKPKDFNRQAENFSESYFPYWIYNQFNKGQDIELDDSTKEDNSLVKKMIIVALWCIQLKPRDRPSMNKVVEMLEGEVESLEMPPKPLVSTPEAPAMDERVSSTSYSGEDITNDISSESYTSEEGS